MRGMLRERFHAKVNYGDGTGCWLWTGFPGNHYGQIRDGARRRQAHHVAFEMAECDVPDGYHVLHMCDTPACVRPTHLRIGTNADNVADKVAKGRQSRGNSYRAAKLTADRVRAIMELAGRCSQAKIAATLGISQALVCGVISGKRWGHV